MTAYDVSARTRAATKLASISNGGKGQAVIITRQGSGSYNNATGVYSTTPTTETGSGIEVAYRADQIDGSIIEKGDKQLLLSALQSDGSVLTAPTPNDCTVTLADGSVWAVVAVETLAPAGTTILYTLQLRAA